MKNDISIIVPIYNAEKYLKKCIESLLNQTKKELEIILINDGSTDNSEQIIKSFNDKRIIYYKNKNQGIGKTRNFGIDKSTGKYIMFIDSDDYLEKDACLKLFNKIDSEDLDLVVCNYYKVEDNKISKINIPSFPNTTLEKSKELLNKINLSPWNKIYKSTLLKNNNIRFIENLKYEDAPFVLEALDKATSIGKVDDYLNYYIVHKKSETTIRDERIFDIIKIVDIIRNYFKNKPYIKEELDYLTISILMNYNIQQRVQQNDSLSTKFIDESFEYLKNNIPNYRKNKYFKDRNFLKSIIEKNKTLSKIYCNLYRRRHGNTK